MLGLASTAAYGQGAAGDLGQENYLLMDDGSTAQVSEDPIGAIDLSGDQRLSVRTYQYRDFSATAARRPGMGVGYRPSRDGDLNVAQIDGIEDLSKAWDTGGIVEYGYNDPSDPRTRAGIDIRIAPGDVNASDGWLLQPGASYSLPFSERLQFNARVYSTIVSPGAASALPTDRQARGGAGWMNSDNMFQDVGVNLGLAYDVNENWRLGTGAGVSRMIGRPGEAATLDDEPAATQFFGGVVLKYKF